MVIPLLFQKPMFFQSRGYQSRGQVLTDPRKYRKQLDIARGKAKEINRNITFILEKRVAFLFWFDRYD